MGGGESMKTYRVTLQRLTKYTIDVTANNEPEAREIALAHASASDPDFQKQVFPAPSPPTIQLQGPIEDEWRVIEIESDDPGTA
jgi:hypothetical protein